MPLLSVPCVVEIFCIDSPSKARYTSRSGAGAADPAPALPIRRRRCRSGVDAAEPASTVPNRRRHRQPALRMILLVRNPLLLSIYQRRVHTVVANSRP